MGIKRKKILIGILAVLIVVAGAIGIYAYIFSQRHKTEYGKKGKITKKDEDKVALFKERLTNCAQQIFTHSKLPYKPGKGAEKSGYKKGVEAMIKGLNTCLVGQKSADGKGYSGKMNPKYLDELLKPKECPTFADNLMKFNKCQFLFEELIDHAGFKDPLEDDDSAGDKAPDAMKADDMAPDAMKADDMAPDAMKADDMQGMK